MVIAPEGFRDEEYQRPHDEFRKAGFVVVTASSVTGEAMGMLGGMAIAEQPISSLHGTDFDALVFVGGAGSKVFFDDADAHRLAKEAAAAGKVVAAICIAPAILANAGVLRGRRATSFKDESVMGIMKDGGAIHTGADVERDGKLITSSGPAAAARFGQEIVRALK